jgi:hypothetical protein
MAAQAPRTAWLFIVAEMFTQISALAVMTVYMCSNAAARGHLNTRHPARKRGTHTAVGQYRGGGLVSAQPGYGSRAFARDDAP